MSDLVLGTPAVKRVKIVGAAMEPNFHDGQIVNVEEVPVEELRRGDVILFMPDGERQYLKRLIGLPGETLEIIDGKVYIDGKVLEEPYLQETSEVNRFPTPPITLKPNEYYVLGDNRNNSSDSRGFGPISGESILGRVKESAGTPAPRTFLMQQVSMLPTIKAGELLSVEEIPLSQLQHGDIIVFQNPSSQNPPLVKRLIGLPGDTIEIQNGKVFINDKPLDEPYLMEPAKGDSPQITLGSDEYYVLGDNRNNSSDSRSFGSVPGDSILGRVRKPTSTPKPRTYLIRQEAISMLPTISEGEVLLMEEVPASQLKRGDIIDFQSPGNANLQILKRLIGLPGETIEIRKGKVFIDGNLLDEPYIMKPGGPDSPSVTLGANEYFTLGDNRENSVDSRQFGPIPSETIRGRVKQ